MPTPAKLTQQPRLRVKVVRVEKNKNGQVTRVEFLVGDHQTAAVGFREGIPRLLFQGSLLHRVEDTAELTLTREARAEVIRVASGVYHGGQERQERKTEKANAPRGWEGSPLGRYAAAEKLDW